MNTPNLKKSAEVLSLSLRRLLDGYMSPEHWICRPCYCPTCGRHYSDIVFPSERVCGVKHRVCKTCEALADRSPPARTAVATASAAECESHSGRDLSFSRGGP